MADAAHAANDIWHRSLEDLLKAIETAEAKAASSISFTVNLLTSTAPVAMPVHSFPRFEKLHVYQLQQLSSGHLPRFQLRLGIIESDLEADAILSTVRKYYPTATKEIIGEADRTAIAQAVSAAQKQAAAQAVSKASPMPPAPSKDAAAPSAAKPDAFVEPFWNIDELLPNLVDAGPSKRDRPSRAAVTPRVRPQGRSGTAQVRLANVPIARAPAPKGNGVTTASPASAAAVQNAAAVAKPAEAVPARAASAATPADSGTLPSRVVKIGTPTTSPPSAPVVPKAPSAPNLAKAAAPRTVDSSVAASVTDSGLLRTLVAKIGTLTASLPSTPVVPKAPPAAKPAEAVSARAVSPSGVASVADSGILRSLVTKIGTLTAALPSTPVAPKAPPAAKPAEAVSARAVSPPVPASVSDSGTLQSLVAKIGTLVDAVETHTEATAAPRPTAVPVPATAISAPAPATAAATTAAVASLRAPVAAPATIPSAPKAVSSVTQTPRTQRTPSIDSTQTIRALTAVELSDTEASLWFVIQLMQSEELIDPEQVPRLDIFSEYRLYSICDLDQGPLKHALRLGFFSSEIAAQAVAGYLAAHFPTTNIKRVSIAERDRFAEQRVVAKKDVGESGQYTVIEVSAPPPLPGPVIEAASTPSEADRSSDAPSFWSRLTRRGA